MCQQKWLPHQILSCKTVKKRPNLYINNEDTAERWSDGVCLCHVYDQGEADLLKI